MDEKFERRLGTSRDTGIIVERQTEWLATTLSRDPEAAEAFMQSMDYKIVADEELFCVFPGKLEVNHQGTERTVLIDDPTIAQLVDRFALSHRVTEPELIELYVGTTIAAHILKNRIKEQIPIRYKRLVNMLVDPDSIFAAIRTSTMFNATHRQDLKQGLMQSSVERLGNINMLRFAFGMLYLEADNPTRKSSAEQVDESRENRTMNLFQDGLARSLSLKPVYQRLGSIVADSMNETGGSMDAQHLGDKVFADSVREFELAACFPMSFTEIHSILRTLR